MQFLTKKKILISFALLVFLIFCFVTLNKALNENKMYSPIFKNEQVIYLPDLNLPKLFSSDEILLGEVAKYKEFSLVNIWASWCIPCREVKIRY